MTKRVAGSRTPVLSGIIGLVLILSILSGGVYADDNKISIAGSTTVLPIAAAVAEAFMDEHPEIDIQVSGGGSGTGIKSIGEKTVQIGMSSRDLKDEELTKYPALKVITVAKDGIQVIVNEANPIEEITLADLKKIYTGEMTNWQELGGDSAAFEIVGRDSASGTREFFHEKVLGKEDFTKFMLEKNSNGAVLQYVSQTPTSIGYVGMGFDEGVKILGIKTGDGVVQPTQKTVKSGDYPLSRDMYMLVNGEPEGNVKLFLDFLTGPAGQKIVEEEGFVAV